MSSTNDKLWNVLCHLSPFLGVPIILPLVIYLVTKEDAASTIPLHAKQVLNFHISMFIYGIIGFLTIWIFIGIIIIFAVSILSIVLAIVGAIKAANDEVYRYPLTIQLVK